MNEEKPAGMHSMRIQIGEISCRIMCNDRDEFQHLKSICSDFITNQPENITIELNVYERMDSERDDSDSTSGFAAEYLEETSTIKAYIEKEPGDRHFDRILFNKLLYHAYYSSPGIKQHSEQTKPLLIHACGILLEGKAVVFIGPGDAGKSTVAGLLGQAHAEVINDETLIFSRNEQDNTTFLVQGTPIIGDYTGPLNVSAPLDCVMILKQSQRTAIYPVDQTVAYTRFIKQIITPSHIGQTDGKAIISTMADFSGELTEMVPFYILEFTLDGGALWHEICRLKEIPEIGR